MELTKKEAFIRQIAAYFKTGKDKQAYELALDFANRFPDDMASHFLLAKAAFALRKYEQAKAEGTKAFNISVNFQDMLAAALLTSTAYLQLKEYAKGYRMLKEMEKKADTEELQTALLVFSLALNNTEEALEHIGKLYRINERLAMDLAMRIVGK